MKGQKKACMWASWLAPGYIIMVYPDNESQGNVAAEIFLLCFLFYLMFDC